MMKNGFDLFTTSPTALEGKITADNNPRCCEVCTTLPPILRFCKLFCKCRKASVFEWLDYKLGKE